MLEFDLIALFPCVNNSGLMIQIGFYMRYRMVASLFLCLFCLACTPKKIASDITAQIMAGGAPAFEMDPDAELAETTGITMLKMIESFHYDNPDNKTLSVLLARSYANYAFGFLEWNMLKSRQDETNQELYLLNETRAKRFYDTGKRVSLNVLKKNSSFKNALTKDLDSFKKMLKGYGKGSVPLLFWTAFSWGGSINLNKDSPEAIIEFPKVEAMMQRVLELDEFYFYGGPHLFFGVSFGSRPAMFGGNLEKSKEHFEKAVGAYQRKFLMALVMYAQIYAVQAQDPTLFESLLTEVMGADAAAMPEQRLANELAKKRAQWLMEHKGQFF